jgi:hypothetical protein
VVYYLHGYIPYDLKSKRELVLTASSYRKYYAPGEFALQKLKDVLNKYSLIFLGFSFQDPLVCDLLRKVDSSSRPQHFALIEAQNANLVSELGVTPVVFENYADIADVLEDVHCTTLNNATLETFDLQEPSDYWARLKKGPR